MLIFAMFEYERFREIEKAKPVLGSFREMLRLGFV